MWCSTSSPCGICFARKHFTVLSWTFPELHLFWVPNYPSMCVCLRSHSAVKMSCFEQAALQSSAHKTDCKIKMEKSIRREHFVMTDLVKCNPLFWYRLLLICWCFLWWICHHAGALRRFTETASDSVIITIKSYFTYIYLYCYKHISLWPQKFIFVWHFFVSVWRSSSFELSSVSVAQTNGWTGMKDDMTKG